MLSRLLARFKDWYYGPVKVEYKRASPDYHVTVFEKQFKVHTCLRVKGRSGKPEEQATTGGVMITGWPMFYNNVLSNTTQSERFVQDGVNISDKIRIHVSIMALLKEADPIYETMA